jgi:inosine-uridine nucleoside N-ribohydrolase
MLASFSPAVDILAITLVFGNVEMQLIKKNAVVILNALADSTPPTKAKKVPVLAVGKKRDQFFLAHLFISLFLFQGHHHHYKPSLLMQLTSTAKTA